MPKLQNGFDELKSAILKVMSKGRDYTTGDIVDGLGRKRGKKEGDPVLRALHRMEKERTLKVVGRGGSGFM